MDLTYLLSQREKRSLNFSKKLYKAMFKKPADEDEDLVVFLGDDQSNRRTWSASSRRIPTLRMNTGKLWHVKSRRWYIGRERLAMQGFPVTPDAALAMGVPILPVRDQKRAASVSGNAMHLSSISVIEFVASACHKSVG